MSMTLTMLIILVLFSVEGDDVSKAKDINNVKYDDHVVNLNYDDDGDDDNVIISKEEEEEKRSDIRIVDEVFIMIGFGGIIVASSPIIQVTDAIVVLE